MRSVEGGLFPSKVIHYLSGGGNSEHDFQLTCHVHIFFPRALLRGTNGCSLKSTFHLRPWNLSSHWRSIMEVFTPLSISTGKIQPQRSALLDTLIVITHVALRWPARHALFQIMLAVDILSGQESQCLFARLIFLSFQARHHWSPTPPPQPEIARLLWKL